MVPRKAVNSVLVLGLMLRLCLLCLPWTSLWVCVTPDSRPPPLFVFRRWLRSRNILKTVRGSVPGEGLVRRIPWPPQNKAALLSLCFCHFTVRLVEVVRVHPSHPSLHILSPRLSSFNLLICEVFLFVRRFLGFEEDFLSFITWWAPAHCCLALLFRQPLQRDILESTGLKNIFSEKVPCSLSSAMFWNLVCRSLLIGCTQQLEFDSKKTVVFTRRDRNREYPPVPRLIWTSAPASSHYF